MEIKSFQDFGLAPELLLGVADMGFTVPTPIQAAAIGPALQGLDLIGQAQTGTGKTAAFSLPLLQGLDTARSDVQAVVLCPTRELAVQVADEMHLLAYHKPGVSVLPVYGGQPIERQLAGLRQGVQVIVGTPGRVMDHMRRGTLDLRQVRMAVLDEADRMLDMGFIEDIEYILAAIPADRQTLLFSATMPPEVRELARKFMRRPQAIQVSRDELTVDGVEQAYVQAPERLRLDVLMQLVRRHAPHRALVFCNSKRKVAALAGRLRSRHRRAAALHGDMAQEMREQVLNQFRTGEVQLLIASDVAARGLDVEGVEAVFNYEVPFDGEAYVHRIGRTARAGRTGRAFTFVGEREMGALRRIQEFAGTTIAPLEIEGLPRHDPSAPSPEEEGGVAERGRRRRGGRDRRSAAPRRGAQASPAADGGSAPAPKKRRRRGGRGRSRNRAPVPAAN